MPRKPQFAAEDVISAALELVRENGLTGLSAPAVAEKMGCSTMPIYSHFKNMQSLEDAVVKRAWELIKAYESEPYTGDAWVDQAIGYIRFAREEPNLLKFTLDSRNQELKHQMHKDRWQYLADLLGDYEPFKELEDHQVQRIRYARAMLSHGVAMSPRVGLNKALVEDDELLARFMSRASLALLIGMTEVPGESYSADPQQ